MSKNMVRYNNGWWMPFIFETWSARASCDVPSDKMKLGDLEPILRLLAPAYYIYKHSLRTIAVMKQRPGSPKQTIPSDRDPKGANLRRSEWDLGAWHDTCPMHWRHWCIWMHLGCSPDLVLLVEMFISFISVDVKRDIPRNISDDNPSIIRQVFIILLPNCSQNNWWMRFIFE